MPTTLTASRWAAVVTVALSLSAVIAGLPQAARAGGNSYPPKLTAEVSPPTAFARPGATHRLTVTLWGQARNRLSGTLRASGPGGWAVSPASQPFTLDSDGVPVSGDYTLSVTVPENVDFGDHRITVSATTNNDNGQKGVHATADSVMVITWPVGTTAEASSHHASVYSGGEEITFVPGNAIDGDATTFWNDNTIGSYPDTLTITAPGQETFSRVTLTSHPAGVPVDFAVETWSDQQGWVNQATVTGNDATTLTVPFGHEVTTTQVRLVVTQAQPSWAGEFTRVAELTP